MGARRGHVSSVRRGSFFGGLVVAVVAALLAPPAQAAPFDPGEIWATVYSEDTFEPLSGATVTLYDAAGGEAGTATTDGNGEAGFTALADGSYFVSAVADGYVEEYYSDSPDLAGATSLFVDEFSGDVADLELAAEPQIEGTVTGPGGTPLDGADVTVYQYDADFDYWDWAGSATTDVDGHYGIGGLEDGDYRLGFSAADHVDEYFDDKPDLDTADDVAVTTGGPAVMADAELETAKHITGTVTDGGSAVADVMVTAEQQVTDEFGDTYWDDVAYNWTGPDGTYSLDVDSGDYRVHFDPDAHLEEWWQDAHVEADADLVSVGATDTTGIDAELDLGGSIAGTVTATAGGAALQGIEVTAYRWNAADEYWEWMSSATTDATGHYSVGNLLGGSYRVGFEDWDGVYLDEYYDDVADLDDADDVAVTIGTATGNIDASLDKSPVITGTVSGPSGLLTDGDYEVSLYEPARFAPSGWSETFADVAVTGGTYRIQGIDPGRYRLGVSAPGLAPEFWADEYEISAADDIVAAKNQTETANVTLGASLTITGTVTRTGGAAVNGAAVEVQRKNTGPEGSYWDDAAFATTGATGAYTADVAPGTYRVRFSHTDHVAEWWDNSATPSRARRLTLATGGGTASAALDRLGRVGGTVSGPSGAVSGAQVTIYRYTRTFDDENRFFQVRQTTTNASGTYLVTGLNPGNYRVGFSAGGLAREFNSDKADVELADDVAVNLNQTTDVDATLAAGALSISGTVSGATGPTTAPVEDATVTVERRVVKQDGVAWTPFASTFTDPAGAWTVPAISGDYRVSFEAFGYQDQWWQAAAVEADADVVTVTAAARTGIDATLARGGVVTGTLTAAGTGQPLPDASVSIESTTGTDSDFASTDDAGHYELANLAPGQYRLRFEADGYLGEWWNNKTTYDAADPITVTVGATTTADAALARAARLSGTVTGTGGAPVADVDVWVETQDPTGDFDYVDSGFTADDGTWEAFAPPGTTRISFGAPFDSDYLDEWYADKRTADAATPVTVGTADIANLDAQLEVGGTLAGTLTGPGATPVEDGRVLVYPAGATSDLDWQDSTYTADDGSWSINRLPAGSYRLQFQTTDQALAPEYWNDKATLAAADPLTVTLGSTTAANAQLAQSSTINGTVTDGTGTGLDEVDVSVYRRQSTGGAVGWTYYGSDTTDADGHYSAPARNGDYRVEFYDYDNRIVEYWDNVTDFDQATTVTVSGADVNDINAQLVDGARISGTVTYPAQKSGWQTDVAVIDTATGDWVGGATVDAHQNHYLVDGLEAGSYRVEFARLADRTPAEAQFYAGKSENLGAGSATAVTLTAAQTRTGVDAVLADGGVLTGVVRDSAGTHLTGCSVTAFTLNGARAGRIARATGDDGATRITGLTTGGYLLQVSGGDCGFRTLYYDGVGQLTADIDHATAVAATRGTAAAIPQDLVVPTGGDVTNQALPTINDTTPEVGQTLTALPGTWTPAGVTFGYEWLVNGTPVVGQTASTYAVRAADAGKRLSVRVTASKPDFVDGVATSAQTAAVVSGDPPITNNVKPAISDTTPQVGQPLTTTNGSWSQTGLTFGYQWLRDGADIAGATSSSYTPVAADEGTALRVRVTASKSGFTPGTATSDPTSAVAPPPTPVITNTVKPVISDTTPVVGQALTTTNGSWSQTGVAFGYQWLRDGVAIAGATTSSYTTAAADVGHPLQVRVTASKAGFTSGSATSIVTAPVVDPTLVIGNATPPTVTGTAAVGRTLTAGGDTWTPADVTRGYQWLRNGTVVAGATASTYRLVAADLGAAMSVRVTASKSGYGSASATSTSSAPVARGTIVAKAPKVVGKPKVGKTLTARAGTSTPSTVKVRYQWLRNGKVIKGAKGKKYKLTRKDRRKKIQVKVTRTAPGYKKLVKKSKALRIR